MMDERRNVFGLGGSQPNSNFKQLSPYLNVDPSLLQTQAPEFITDQEMTRGKLENSFTAIHTGLFVGVCIDVKVLGLIEWSLRFSCINTIMIQTFVF